MEENKKKVKIRNLKDERKDYSLYSPPIMHEKFGGKYRGNKPVSEASSLG